jgi:hypothetical protein
VGAAAPEKSHGAIEKCLGKLLPWAFISVPRSFTRGSLVHFFVGLVIR